MVMFLSWLKSNWKQRGRNNKVKQRIEEIDKRGKGIKKEKNRKEKKNKKEGKKRRRKGGKEERRKGGREERRKGGKKFRV